MNWPKQGDDVQSPEYALKLLRHSLSLEETPICSSDFDCRERELFHPRIPTSGVERQSLTLELRAGLGSADAIRTFSTLLPFPTTQIFSRPLQPPIRISLDFPRRLALDWKC